MIDKKLALMLYQNGNTLVEIASRLGVSKQRIHQIVSNYRNYGNQRFNKKELKQLKKRGEKCEICRQPYTYIHHIDFNNSNDSLENLIKVCKKCHIQLHAGRKIKNKYSRLGIVAPSKTLEYNRKYRPLKPRFEWSLKYKECIVCLSTERIHYARGLCRNCYMRENWKKWR